LGRHQGLSVMEIAHTRGISHSRSNRTRGRAR